MFGGCRRYIHIYTHIYIIYIYYYIYINYLYFLILFKSTWLTMLRIWGLTHVWRMQDIYNIYYIYIIFIYNLSNLYIISIYNLSLCILLFYSSLLNWHCCVSFCYTAKWISYTYMYILFKIYLFLFEG